MTKRVAITKRAKALLSAPRSPQVANEDWGDFPGHMWRGAFKLEKQKEYYFPSTGWTPIPKGGEIDRWNDNQLVAIRKAFDHFGLNPNDPFAWRLLVEYVAFAFFWKPQKTRGAPPKWTKQKIAELKAIVARFPGMSDIAIAKKIANDKKSPFYVRGTSLSDGVRGLRKNIGQARKSLTPK